jgi:formylglycine-generating enzyme required for sulfatase activity
MLAAGGGAPGPLTFALAETYDPNMLAAWGIRDFVSDVMRAKELYRKTLGLGITRAHMRLEQLEPSSASRTDTIVMSGVAISVTTPLRAEPASRVRLPIEIRPPEAVPKNTFVRIHGLPPVAVLSEGHAIAPGSWAVPLNALPTLRVILPAGVQGQSDVAINLLNIDGSLLAETRTIFIVEVTSSAKPAQPAVAVPPPPTPTRCDGVEAQVGNERQRRCLKPKDSFRDCDTCPEMVVVPSGSFTMGSPANEPERSGDEAQARVSIAAPFAVGKYAVTFVEWDACVADGGCNGYKPDDAGWGRGRQPVINVNWHDAKAYAKWLSSNGKNYRLLSEAEREYVTRAGTTTPFWWGSSLTPKQANYDGSYTYAGGGSRGEYRKRTMPVDSFEANPWGLYHVHGNVWEWTEDCWNDSNAGNPGDGRARTSGNCKLRVVRGGSWGSYPSILRAALRIGRDAIDRLSFEGFRVARTLPRY